MSMIKCTECGNDISDKATSCPHCGCPMDAILRAEKAKSGKRTMIFALAILCVLVLVAVSLWYFLVKMPKDRAVAEYTAIVETYNAEVEIYNNIVDTYNTKISGAEKANAQLSEVLADAQAVLDSGEIPFDADVTLLLKTAIEEAQRKVVKTPSSLEKMDTYDIEALLADNPDIEAATATVNDELEKLTQEIADVESADAQLQIPNYNKQINEITDAKEQFEISCAVQKQIIYPTQDFVLNKLADVENVAVIACVTEDNDINGKLGTEGGYTAQIFFSSPLLKTESITEDELLEIGTDAGGSVEIYATEQDARARDEYLASFDDTKYDTGKHTVVGTMIVRVSTNLTTTKQDMFSEEIIDALLSLDK